MKTRVKLRLLQADMRSRGGPYLMSGRGERRRRRAADGRLARQPDELKKRIAELVLIAERGYTSAQIEQLFGWAAEDVERWIRAGKSLI